MLDKYTIFDNFDKLDLSPAATEISAEALPIINSTVQDTVNKVGYGSYNETNFVSKKNRPFPYSFDLKNGGYAPDLYKFLLNDRFFISLGGDILHGSNMENGLEISKKNIFKNEFFLDIYTSNFSRLISNNSILYDNKIEVTEFENDYFSDQDDLYPLYLESTFNDFNTPFLGGINRILFNPVATSKDLKLIDLLNQNPTQAEYIYNNLGEQAISALSLFLQRILYPYKTPIGRIPKHIYFVADLRKSLSLEQNEDQILYTDAGDVTTTPVYNYYKASYEEYPDNVELEWQLPSAYAFYSFLKSTKFTAPFTYFANIVKIDSTVSDIYDFNLDQYYEFSNISTTHIGETSDEGYEKYLNLLRHKAVIFGKDTYELGEGLKSVKHLFPYYVEVDTPSIDSPLANDLLDKNLIDSLMSLIGNYFSGMNAGLKDNALHTFSIHNQSQEATQGSKLSLSTLQVFDLSSDFSNYSKFLPDIRNVKFASSEYYLSEFTNVYQVGLNAQILRENILDYCDGKGLTFEQISSGEKCYSEILALEVVKSQIIDGEKTPLQSFFIPCLNEKGNTLFDTQVFYDKEYIYEVYSISLVVGSEYSSELGTPNGFAFEGTTENVFEDNKIVQFEKTPTVQITPSGPIYLDSYTADVNALESKPEVVIKPILVRAPYHNNLSLLNDAIDASDQESVTLLDKPPLAPDISFYPYKDIDNKILILLNVNYGERKLFPIRVFPEDRDKIKKYYDSQKHLNLKPGEILYKTDDFKGTYKIYRTTIKPTNWSAFADFMPQEIDNAQASGYQDDILPNVDYYYFARFEDIHENISNPTNIFYIRMVKEGGFPPYLIVKPYYFSEGRDPYIYEKKFKKYLKVRLADGTREYYNTDDVTKADFGYKKANSNSQLKKYKIRITSAKTGKKIDINLDFTKSISDQYLTKELDVEKETLQETEQKKTLKNTQNKVEKGSDFDSFDNQIAKTPKFISEGQSTLDPTGGKIIPPDYDDDKIDPV